MSHVTINPDGAIVYRTKVMELTRAAAFARCLEANGTRFESVEILEAKRTTETLYFVTFRPVSAERQGDLYEAQWNVRAERAREEGGDYIFWRDGDNPGCWWCFNPMSGETYQVSVFGCTCPDYHYRCEKAGLHCKHQHALELQKGGRADKQTESREARHARIQASIHRDF